MQPRILKMQNFGPFINETVDFGDFQEAGLFLISGKTGAGKTTIFDGMTFALFGETSGQLRSGKEMRSMFATPLEETVVTFTFEHQDFLYEIERYPEQEVLKKRGEGTRTQAMKVRLTIYKNGEVQRQYSKRGEVDQFIKELLHLDAKQFFQIILLPQGEFRNFLIASSSEKEKLLRNLFGTELYQRLNDWLNQQKKALEQGLSKQQHQMEAITARFQWQKEAIQAVSINETLQLWEAEMQELVQLQQKEEKELLLMKEKEKQAEKKLYEAKDLAKALIEYEKLKADQTKFAEMKPDIDLMNGRYQRLLWIEKQESLLKNLDDCQQERQKIAENITCLEEELAQNKQAIEQWQGKMAQIETQRQLVTEQEKIIQRLEDLLPQAEAVQSLLNQKQKVDQFIQEISSEKTSIKNQLVELATEITDKEKQLNKRQDLQQKEIQLIQGKNLVTSWSDLRNACDNLENKINELIETDRLREIEIEQFNQQLIIAEEQLKQVRSKNAKMQIARLQLLLVDGEACPVCGSTEHHHEQAESYSSEEIQQSEVELTEIEEQVKQLERVIQQKIFESSSDQQTELTIELSRKQDRSKEIFGECEALFETKIATTPLAILEEEEGKFQEEKAQLEQAEIDKNLLMKQQMNLQTKEADLQEKLQEYQVEQQQIVTKLTILQEQMQQRSYAELKDELEELQRSNTNNKTEILTYEEQGESLRLSQASLAEAHKQQKQNLQTLANRKDNYQKELNKSIEDSDFEITEEQIRHEINELWELTDLKRQLEEYQQNCQFVSQRLDELSDIANQEVPNIPLLEEAFQQAEEKVENCQKTIIHYEERVRHNQTLFDELHELVQDSRERIDELSQLEQLFKTMNGDNPERISIERYVLQSFLTEILEVANQRLIKLTRGRYQFLLNEEKGSYRSSTGLEINIFDDNAGMSRRAHTLSGGESFIAALALALSLADVIQNRSGGIAIEALFIDEGFGSLDEESLEMAMEALELIENEGRLIGIISHVRELKDRVQQQLIVETNGSGQSHIKTRI